MADIKKLYFMRRYVKEEFDNNTFIFSERPEDKAYFTIKDNFFKESKKYDYFLFMFIPGNNPYLSDKQNAKEAKSLQREMKLCKFANYKVKNGNGVVEFTEVCVYNEKERKYIENGEEKIEPIDAFDINNCNKFKWKLNDQAYQTPIEIENDTHTGEINFNYLNDPTFSFKNHKRTTYLVKESLKNDSNFKSNLNKYDLLYVVDEKLNIKNIEIYLNEKNKEFVPYKPLNDKLSEMVEKNLYKLKDLWKENNNTHKKELVYCAINKLNEVDLYNEDDRPNKKQGFYTCILSQEDLKNKSKKQKKEQKVEEIKQDDIKGSQLNNYLAQNTIFYGAPGCGKSRFIKDLLNNSQKSGTMPNSFFKRVLFYPDYSYADFVGQVLPVFNEESGRIEYKFQPGPFVEILKDAIANEKNQHFLIIEEINRGNAPAIFGDIFQLLDRNYDGNQKGKSEFEINNKEIQKIIGKDSVYIPANLTILATMNTCDQNVFVLDTAFKRRWRMERISNEFKEEDNFKKVSVKKDEKDFFKWIDFREKVNETIMNLDEDMGLDDKLLGTHFVNSKDISDIKIFAEKVFMYLWNDVVRYNKKVLFGDYKTLDNLIEKFVEGENVFAEGTPIREFYNNVLEKKLKKKA